MDHLNIKLLFNYLGVNNMDDNDDHANNGYNDDQPPLEEVEEKLKIDRKRFEAMLAVDESVSPNAHSFFNGIMSAHNVQIQWPSKLKAGTKSKKDPHVRVSGTPDMVKEAKKMILDVLDARRDRVTLKMDVDWTAHAHIIGKGGACIQRVMDQTGCHVHFPDANRTCELEKSNQVSIAGTALGVDAARKAIRQLVPIIVTFDFPANRLLHQSLLDPNNQRLQNIQSFTGTQISFRFEPQHSVSGKEAFVAIVKGFGGEVEKLETALAMYTKFIIDSTSRMISTDKSPIVELDFIFQTSVEIACQHHAFMAGTDGRNIQAIMQDTNTQILFPEYIERKVSGSIMCNGWQSSMAQSGRNVKTIMQAMMQSNKRRSTVIIKGKKACDVLNGWKQLLSNLPLSLTFDLQEEHDVIESSVPQIESQFKTTVSVQSKPSRNAKSIWLKCAEKNATQLFAARNHILNIGEQLNVVKPKIWPSLSDVRIDDGDCVLFPTNLGSGKEEESTANMNNHVRNMLSDFDRTPGAERSKRNRSQIVFKLANFI